MRRFLARLWLGRYREELTACGFLALFGLLVWLAGWQTLFILWGVVLVILAGAWVWVLVTERVQRWAEHHAP